MSLRKVTEDLWKWCDGWVEQRQPEVIGTLLAVDSSSGLLVGGFEVEQLLIHLHGAEDEIRFGVVNVWMHGRRAQLRIGGNFLSQILEACLGMYHREHPLG